MKAITYILLISTLGMFGQNKIAPNRNPLAPKHEMSLQKDSLIVSSAYIIDKVNIWNEGFDFEKYFNEKYIVVDISGFPVGRYLVATSINKQFIISELFKVNEPIITETTTLDTLKKENKPVKEFKSKVVYITVPYNLSTTVERRDNRESDTIYVKETREQYKARMGYDKGKKQ